MGSKRSKKARSSHLLPLSPQVGLRDFTVRQSTVCQLDMYHTVCEAGQVRHNLHSLGNYETKNHLVNMDIQKFPSSFDRWGSNLNITNGDFPCNCFYQMVNVPGLIWWPNWSISPDDQMPGHWTACGPTCYMDTQTLAKESDHFSTQKYRMMLIPLFQKIIKTWSFLCFHSLGCLFVFHYRCCHLTVNHS